VRPPGKTTTAAVLAVWEHYRGYHPRAVKVLKRSSGPYQKILARLKEGSTVEDLCQAIDGNHCSPWHNGENPGNKPYHSLELILRSATKVTDFIEIYERLGTPVLSERTVRGLRAASSWLDSKEGEDETTD
jgi:hypothetical protein